MSSTVTIDDIVKVQLSNREVHGEYVVYTALSRDGVTEYRVTLHDGHATGCTCPAIVKCLHKKAAEFEEFWSAPIASALLGEQFAEDLQAHVEDSIENGDFVDPFAGMSKEQRREAYRNMYPGDFYEVA